MPCSWIIEVSYSLDMCGSNSKRKREKEREEEGEAIDSGSLRMHFLQRISDSSGFRWKRNRDNRNARIIATHCQYHFLFSDPKMALCTFSAMTSLLEKNTYSILAHFTFIFHTSEFDRLHDKPKKHEHIKQSV